MKDKHWVDFYISNLSEDVWPFIQALKDDRVRQTEIMENATSFSSRDLLAFCGRDNLTIILPSDPGQEFIDYYLNLFGNKNLRILVTKNHQGETCRDIWKDKAMMAEIKKARKINLTAYSTSPQFLELVRELRKQGAIVQTPESPAETDAWIINFYGSKLGFRQLAQESQPELKMAKGLICWGTPEAAKLAAKMYRDEGGVVIKTNKGHAGMGLKIFRPGDLKSESAACQAEILRQLKAEDYWDKFPMVIEKCIAADMTNGGGFPNVEMKILPSGKVEKLYFCGMRVMADGVFRGIEIHRKAIDEKAQKQITKIGKRVGRQYAKMGYRGYFELDFVAGKDGIIYLTESNVRRTGGTHVYHTARALFGKNFINQRYTLSNNFYEFTGPAPKTLTEFLEKLKSVLFNRESGEGVIVSAANLLFQKKLAYIIFGKTKERALALEQKMIELIK